MAWWCLLSPLLSLSRVNLPVHAAWLEALLQAWRASSTYSYREGNPGWGQIRAEGEPGPLLECLWEVLIKLKKLTQPCLLSSAWSQW